MHAVTLKGKRLRAGEDAYKLQDNQHCALTTTLDGALADVTFNLYSCLKFSLHTCLSTYSQGTAALQTQVRTTDFVEQRSRVWIVDIAPRYI